MIKICKHCNKEFDFEKIQQFAAHVNNCKENPNWYLKHKKISEKLKGRKRTNGILAVEYKVNCIKCGKEFIVKVTKKKFEKGTYKKYCSFKCANSHIRTKESNKLLSLKMKGAEGSKKEQWTEDRKVNFQNAIIKNVKLWNDKLLNEDFESLSFQRLSKRVKLEQEGKCNKCGLNEWQEEKLTLELEHKDGNRNNNKRENLEALCPNCHSLTSTWRGRNCKNKEIKITDEELLRAILNNKNNISQALIEVGLVPKGGNYIRVYKIMKMANINKNGSVA